jgi:hypothetical protein
MAWAGMARRVAAAARLMASMNGRAVDGLEGGDAAGHLKLRGGKRVGKLMEFSEVAPSAQAVCLSSNAADFNIAPSRHPRRERLSGLAHHTRERRTACEVDACTRSGLSFPTAVVHGLLEVASITGQVLALSSS